MEQWLRDSLIKKIEQLSKNSLAEKLRYVNCLLAPVTYIHCDVNCEKCEYYINFKEWLEKSKEGD